MTKVTMPPASVIVEDGYELRWAGPEPISKLVEGTGARVGSVLITTEQAEAYANARVRQALEEAAKIPRAYAEEIDNGLFGKRYPEQAAAIFNASTNMADRIRALIPKYRRSIY